MASNEEIIFYDILSKLSPERSWSPNTLRTRLILNYKNLPYRTEWVSLPRIAGTLKALGCPPNPTPRRKGLEHTLPAISHSSLPHAINETLDIAEHLEKTFPEPPIFPGSGAKVIAAAVQAIFLNLALPNTLPLIVHLVPDILDDEGREYYVRTRTEWFGDLQEFNKNSGDWNKMEPAVKSVETLLDAEPSGPFMLGTVPSYADFIIVAWLGMLKVLPADKPGEMLENLLGLGGGSLRRLWEASQQWL